MDATHKVYCKIVSENQVICVESLTVKNMMKNPKLAKHIVDANWRVIWHDLSDRFSSYQACHRLLQQWERDGLMEQIIEALAIMPESTPGKHC